jgi:hypothetical protein
VERGTGKHHSIKDNITRDKMTPCRNIEALIALTKITISKENTLLGEKL